MYLVIAGVIATHVPGNSRCGSGLVYLVIAGVKATHVPGNSRCDSHSCTRLSACCAEPHCHLPDSPRQSAAGAAGVGSGLCAAAHGGNTATRRHEYRQHHVHNLTRVCRIRH